MEPAVFMPTTLAGYVAKHFNHVVNSPDENNNIGGVYSPDENNNIGDVYRTLPKWPWQRNEW